MPVVLTGRIEAEDEARLAFRLSGRMIERGVNVGDRVEAGQLIGRLDAQDQQNALRAAEANLAAAQGQAREAENEYQRQRQLEERGFAARAVYERARQARQTTRSQVEAAEAQLRFAQDQVSFTELARRRRGRGDRGRGRARRGGAGRPDDRAAGPPGRPRRGVRRAGAGDPLRTRPTPRSQVFLTEDPSIRAVGRVREVGGRRPTR